MFRRAITSALLLGLIVGTGVARTSAPLTTASGTLLGVWVDDGNRTWTRESVESFESLIGRRVALDHRFYSWDAVWPGPDERWDRDAGRIPLITWEPWNASLPSIARGEHDELIRARAREARAYAHPLFLRWGHEMNGNWYPWDGSHNGNDASVYVAAWRRLVGIFRSEGATNVTWVWCPNAESIPDEAWNHWTAYYPGDDYVDWVGIDGYNLGTTEPWSSWRSFAGLFQPVYDTYASRKPIAIVETGSAEEGGDKAAWIAEMAEEIKTRMTGIRALVYFNARERWPAQTSDTARDAFVRLAHDAHFAAKDSS